MKLQIVNTFSTVVINLTDQELEAIHEGEKLYRTKQFQAVNEDVGERSTIDVHFIFGKQED